MEYKIDYNFVESVNSDFYSVKLLRGRWKNVIYTYGQVSIKENEANACAILNFNFKIEDSYKFDKEALIKSKKFKEHIGNVLSHVLTDSDAKIGTQHA